ncbi:uncharacterized protein LOC127003890 [Eriocheir sinensis]|uniref:uncharacterized protein LOC127003890 n=1 Tax=Eriocheir sinensis TaxID=95602 RepID=UPI0021C69292|nr:uncharacterized protein LOC127003890 [Eriocheir sinensis]
MQRLAQPGTTLHSQVWRASVSLKRRHWESKRSATERNVLISTVPEHSGSLVSSGKKNRQNDDIIKPESVISYKTIHLSEKQTMSTREFRLSLVFSLTDHPAEEALRLGRSSCNVTGRRTLHSLVELDGPKRQTRKRCRGCYEKIYLNEGYAEARNKARRVSTYCDHCDDKPHLCLPCFTEKYSEE